MGLEFVFIDCANSFYNCRLGIVTPSIVRKGFLCLRCFQISGFLHFHLSFKLYSFKFKFKLSKMLENINWFGMSTIVISSWELNNFDLFVI